MQMFLIVWKIITKRQVVEEGMEKFHMPFFCLMTGR